MKTTKRSKQVESLAKTHPHLIQVWHPTKNAPLSPSDVTAGSNKKVWWQCPVALDHEWDASVNSVVKSKKIGCPCCRSLKIVESNCLATTHPNVAKIWHPTKNAPLTPRDVTSGYNEKIWWKCPKGDDHEWNAPVYNVKKAKKGNLGCPQCKGLKPSKANNLLAMYPDVAKLWHPTKNEKQPEDITTGSGQVVWWKCPKGDDHEWEAAITTVVSSNKNGFSGCPVCRGIKVAFSTCLATTHPHLLDAWDKTKNKISPHEITASSHVSIWWKCPVAEDHEWSAPPYNVIRLENTIGCPMCRGFQVVTSNCLATTHPELTTEWDYEKNGEVTPLNVTAGSGKKVRWKCVNGQDHSWIAPIGDRVNAQKKGQGKCPFCQGQKVALSNCLATLYPEIAKEWDPKDNSKTPYDVTAGSSQKVNWTCKIDPSHKWMTTVSSRVSGTGCPYCKGKKASSANCLAILYPEIAKEWDFEVNSDTPYDVTVGSGKKIGWICKKDPTHKWMTTVGQRVRGTGCPYCQGQKVDLSNCLGTLYPEIAKEWVVEANRKTPFEVTPGSNEKVIWKCQKDSTHMWEATVKSRVVGRGCSYCNLGWTIENIRHFVKSLINYLDTLTPAGLYVLFQQNGLLDIDSATKGRTFVQALKTGRFPKDELEKFVNGSPSLVDQFLNSPSTSLAQNQLDNLESPENCLSEKEFVVEETLPIVETKDILTALDSKLFSNLDREAIDFFIKEAVARIWQHTFSNESEALQQLELNNSDGEYPREIKRLFLSEHEGTKKLQIPDGYSSHRPNLMQRYTAYLVKSRKRLGNWCGTGAGKTISAILASKVIGANLIVICCPNNVIDNWERTILQAYPRSYIQIKNIDVRSLKNSNETKYLILNYEFFQQPIAESKLKALLKECCVDFVIIDEIHYSKQREVEKISDRKRVIASFLSEAAAINGNLHILGMSATPVINNLFEGKTLIELITGTHHDDLQTKATVPNCISHYQKFVSHGIRWVPQYSYVMNLIKEDVDCTSQIAEIKHQNSFGSMVDVEAVLTRAKIPYVLKHIRSKTVVYTHYVKNILTVLQTAIEQEGWKVAIFTGENKDGLNEFVDGDADVLIASSCVGTGVDRLQHVCNRLIINSLPWTHAEFEQLKGRFYRQGQKYDHVDIFVPLTYAEINGERWSWCESKWKRIQFKKSISDAAVDGVIPDGHLRTPAQAYQDAMNWLKRLEEGKLHDIERQKINLQLSEEAVQKGLRKFGDFSKMNHQLNCSSSATTHKKFQQNPEDWEYYHSMYREARKEWTIIPYKEAAQWCKARPHLVIGDFGCGEALLAQEIENKVHSFDHIAINKEVTACDIAHVPLDDESLDAAVFSLSLMGINYLDYIKEAHRCLKLDGYLWIAEATSRFQNLINFEEEIIKVGFDVVRNQEKGKFTFLRAIKSDRISHIKQ